MKFLYLVCYSINKSQYPFWKSVCVGVSQEECTDKGLSFVDHQENFQKTWNYIYYYAYLRMRNKNELDGPEFYVWECIGNKVYINILYMILRFTYIVCISLYRWYRTVAGFLDYGHLPLMLQGQLVTRMMMRFLRWLLGWVDLRVWWKSCYAFKQSVNSIQRIYKLCIQRIIPVVSGIS